MASLARSPKKNWIENLPKPMQTAFEHSWLHRVAEHLVKEQGFTVGHAIAVGVNAAKKACSTGDLNWPGHQQINPKSRAEACAAVALWESMKAESGGKVKKSKLVSPEDVESVFKAFSEPQPGIVAGLLQQSE